MAPNLPPSDINADVTADVQSVRRLAIERSRDRLRPGQQSMVDWRGGPLAVSAVPGAGKSTGMAVAAACAIARHQLNAKRQLLVVTFTRSAAANLKQKIRHNLKELSLPYQGFTVQTLHGLALNIAIRHPDLSGINLETVTVVSPTQSNRLIRDAVERWISQHPRRYGLLLEGLSFDGEETERLRRQSVLRTEVLPELAQTAIREAKSSGLSPLQLWELAAQTPDDYGILNIAAGLYEQYQQLLKSRELIDYDEMILAALRVLENDTARQLWQRQIFAVFEDEAQDSSLLQFNLLKTLASDPENPDAPPNLVRVGDPNQAINSTFTPADPVYFREFCADCQLQGRLAMMDQAGRSSQRIMEAANFMLQRVNQAGWAGTQQPFITQTIRPVSASDPQPDANPEPTGWGLELCTPKDCYQSVAEIGKRVIELFQKDPTRSAAVLVRENRQGAFIAEQLEYLRHRHHIAVVDVGTRDRTSHVPSEMLALLQFLDRPHSSQYLKAALEVLVKQQCIPTQDLNALATLPEQFLYPSPLDPPQNDLTKSTRTLCRELLQARLALPPYHLIGFLAQKLQYDPSELATAEKLAERLTFQAQGRNSLGGLIQALSEIVTSERFEGVDTEDSDDRYCKPHQLTIITMHKAKGLDWDYVFLPFLQEDSIPGSPWVPTGSQFLGDFTLAEVARAQIRASLHDQYPLPEAPIAWKQAQDLKAAEEFRLLYVAMTRAKRLLWMAAETKGPFRWNTFNFQNVQQREQMQEKKPCPVFTALRSRFPQAVMSIK